MTDLQERLYTAADVAAMADDGKTYELHNGVLIEAVGSKKRQTQLAAWIIYLLTAYIQQSKIGGRVSGADGTFQLNIYNTRLPDVGYLTAATDANQDDNSYMQGGPDLAVEVVSPSNSPADMQQRAGEYLLAGSRLVWIVNPDQQTVDIYRPGGTRIVASGSDVLDGYEVLPGLQLPLPTLFNLFP